MIWFLLGWLMSSAGLAAMHDWFAFDKLQGYPMTRPEKIITGILAFGFGIFAAPYLAFRTLFRLDSKLRAAERIEIAQRENAA